MLAIAGGKGGCGKTTTALGLARALAAHGARPLVADADPDMPDVHHVLDLDPESGVDAVARGTAIQCACKRPPALPGVAVLTAGSRDNYAEVFRQLDRWHGPVLVDCPAGVGPDATRPLRHTDHSLLVTTDDPQCLEDTARTATTARELDATPIGTVYRAARASDMASIPDRPPRADGLPEVCAHVPTVDADPLTHPQTRIVWTRLAETVAPDHTESFA